MKPDTYELLIEYILSNQEKFYRLAYSYARNENDALDIVQNAICKALENYRSIHEIAFIRTWFYRIIVHESINYLKKQRREILSEVPPEEKTGYEEKGYRESEGFFEELSRLPPDTQTVIRLRFYEELSLQEIAQVTEVNINTVKARLYRGLKALKEELTYEQITG